MIYDIIMEMAEFAIICWEFICIYYPYLKSDEINIKNILLQNCDYR